MLGGTTPITAVLGSAPAPTSPTLMMRNYAKAAASVGLSLLLINPGTKQPADPRGPKTRREADTAAQNAARAAGRPDWARVKSPAGVHLATSDPKTLGTYVDNFRKTHGPEAPINMAVAVGPSRLIIVDCDTTEQVAAFLADSGIPADMPLPPTVRSPGQRDAEGNWVHYGGGHFWFTLPEGVTLPTETGSMTMPGGYAVLWDGRYVLIPPSVRPEGAYELSGQDYPAPAWLIDTITAYAAKRESRRVAPGEDLGEMAANIDGWASSLTWADILEPAGWEMAARPDGCGCEVWTAPGTHASPKSATTHDTGCTYGRYSEVNAPCKIWTDNPGEALQAWVDAHGGSTVLSKLQMVAALYYEGNVGRACAELKLIPPSGMTMDIDGVCTSNLDEDMCYPGGEGEQPPAALDYPVKDWPDANEVMRQVREASAGSGPQAMSDNVVTGPWTTGSQTANAAAQFVAENEGQPYTFGTAETGCSDNTATFPGADPNTPAEESPFDTEDTSEADDGILEPGSTYMPRIAIFDHWRDLPAPEYVVEGLIENGGLVAINGAPGVGKSAVTLDIINAIVTGQNWHGRRTMQQRVLYLPGEGLSGAVARVRAWEKAHKADVGKDLIMGDSILRAGAPKEAWEQLTRLILTHQIGVIVFDTFARMAVGIEENSATEVGKVIARLDQVRKLTGCTVILVHHTAKGSTAGRGSSALNGAVDTEILVTDTLWETDEDHMPPGKQLQVTVPKQKNAEQITDGIPLLMVSFEDSVVIAGPSGEIGDVLDEAHIVRAVRPETSMETAVRLARALRNYTQQGLSIAEAAGVLKPDEWTARRTAVAREWKLALRKAVDLALQFQLIETLSGTPGGARYILSTATVDQFRSAVIAAGLSD